MTAANLKELADSSAGVVPLTVNQYHRMIETGILVEGDPIELLDGFLVRKDRAKQGDSTMTVGHQHAIAVGQLVQLNERLRPLGGHIRIQQPVALPPENEPEPDGAIVRGSPRDYKGHPGPADIICVIEVADSSLNRDRTTKQRIYADAGITHYFIVNLIDKTVEDFRDRAVGTGQYRQTKILRVGDQLTLTISAGNSIDIAVAELLP